MAEPIQSPALPSTADTTPYVPVSWAAVAAAAVAGLFAFLLLALGISAFVNKKPLLLQELLVLPVVAVVLSFAARRTIRNSEGTRTGERLADAAWWTALVLGLGYVAYLFAIDFAVRREAGAEIKQWVDQVRDDKLDAAFYKTIPPGARGGVRNDAFELQRRYGAVELVSFRNTDLVRLARRNRGVGEFVFTPGGVADWSYRPGAIDCVFTGTVTCPEGVFPVSVPLKGVEGVNAGETGGGGRQWSVAWRPGGTFVQQEKVERTGYGWLVLLLELEGSGFGKAFIDHINFGPASYPYLHRAFIAEPADPSWLAVARSPAVHVFFAAPFGILHPNAYRDSLAASFFKGKDGAEPTAEQTGKFLAAWNVQGVFEAGRRLKDPAGGVADKDAQFRLADGAAEVLVPVEIPIQNAAGKQETARGKLVVACNDPALLAELKERKGAAKTEKPANSPPVALRDRSFAWRVVRIESDLVPVSIQQPGAGGPHGAGGHGG